MLGVSKSGHYVSRSRPPSERRRQDALLTEKIREISTTFGRSLAASENYQPHSVHFCSGEGEDESDEGTGIEGGELGDGLQVDGRRRREVEEVNRLSTGGIDEGWSEVR
jgi:hypothetical protein